MNAKSIVTVLLLTFVGVSVVYLVITEAGSRAKSKTPSEPRITAPATRAVDESESDRADQPADHRLVAYYFHRTQRCHKCLTIETYAEEALKEAFPEAVGRGELEWHAVNVEEPANEHFVEEYGLTSSALVLLDLWDGEPREWRNLEQVWDLVGDEPRFKTYVQTEARALWGDGS
jgi:hypothetical protein